MTRGRGEGWGHPPACAEVGSSWAEARGRPLWGPGTPGDQGGRPALRGRGQGRDCGRGRGPDLARVHCRGRYCSSGNPRMTAGRWVASLAAEFPRMSSILEAGGRPEARGQDSPASGPDSLRSSLCCKGQLRRWAGHGRSSRAGARDLGSQCFPLGGRREVQEVRPGIQGHEDLRGDRAWHRGDRRGNPGLEEGHQLLDDVGELLGLMGGRLVRGQGSCCIRSAGDDQVHGRAGDQGGLRGRGTRGNCRQSYP